MMGKHKYPSLYVYNVYSVQHTVVYEVVCVHIYMCVCVDLCLHIIPFSSHSW